MASTFAGLAITSRGLNAASVGLATTTNNISNVNTDGYSRQVLSQTAVGPAAVYSSSSLVGSGVEVNSVDRVRSFRLDQKYWAENSQLGDWETKSSYLTEAEQIILPDTDDSSFTTTLDDFYDALEAMSTSTSESTIKAAVSAASSVCEDLNSMSTALSDLRDDVNTQVKTTVDEINSYASQIAALNGQISTATASGAETNELEDQRDLLIDNLSALTEVSVSDDYTITIGNGAVLVNGDKSNEMECYTVTDSSSDAYGMYGIRWSETGMDLDTGDTGTLTSLMELRDGTGENGDYQGIPYYVSQLNDFARTFAEVFNEGLTYNGTSYSGFADGVAYGDGTTTGIRFFSYDNKSTSALLASGSSTDAIYANITAANISLSSDITADSTLFATASSSGTTGNTDNLKDLITLCGTSSTMFDGTSPNDAYAAIVATLATSSSYASRQYSIKDDTVSYVDESRSAVSGVSTNEETANMVTYQSAYDATAAMVSTWSEIYKTTINMVSD